MEWRAREVMKVEWRRVEGEARGGDEREGRREEGGVSDSSGTQINVCVCRYV